MIEIEITGELIIASWYKLWAAAIAVVGVCVTYGKDGVAIIQGRLHFLPTNFSRELLSIH